MPKPAKKSDTLEIRLPHADKTAFMARCRAEGTTASETVRNLIVQHLAESDAVRPSRRWLRPAVGAAAALGAAAVALPSVAQSMERASFDQLDTDGNGTLDRAEFDRGAGVSVRIEAAVPGPGDVGFTLPRRRSPHGALRSLILRGAFDELDRDGDGVLTFTEFRRR